MREHTCRMNPIVQVKPTQPQKEGILLRLHNFFDNLSAPAGKTGGCAFFFPHCPPLPIISSHYHEDFT